MRYLLALLLALATVAASVADDDHDRALWRRERREILPLEELLRRLDLGEGVRILEIESEMAHGDPAYKIEYLDAGGRIREVLIDAKSGQILADEEDD